MAQQAKNSGWLCLWCRVMNGKHAICCHRCGGKWYEVGEDAEDGGTTYSRWSRSPGRTQPTWETDQKPKSPRYFRGRGRGQTPSPRPKQNRTRRGKKPQAADQAQISPTMALPGPSSGSPSWLTMMQMQQSANQAAQQAAQTAQEQSLAQASQPVMPQQTAAMKQLLSSLKKDHDKLSPENQELVKNLTVKEEKDEEKELQSAAKSLGRARRDLQEAMEARTGLHQQWRKFLSMSVEQWKNFTTEFQQQEQASIQTIQLAKEALAQAKQNLDVSKEAFHSPKQATEVHDLMSEEDTQEESGAQKLQEGLHNLSSSLQNLHKAAEDAIEEEQQRSKKARLGDAKDVSTLPGGQALQPFHGPGMSRQ